MLAPVRWLPIDKVADVSGRVARGRDRPEGPVPVEINGSAERLERYRVGEVELAEDSGVIDQAVVESVAKVIELCGAGVERK
jgi:hypothetical protein